MTGWSNLDRGRKLIVLWGGAFTALVASIFSFTQILTATESYHPALRGFVRDEISKTVSPLVAGQVENQIETVQVRLQMLDKETFELDMMLGAQAAPIPDLVRTTLQLRHRALDDDRKNLEFRLDQLQRARSGRRP